MRHILFLCVVNICLTWKLSACKPSMIEQIFKTNGIVPDVVDVAPPKSINIIYQESHKEVMLGNELTPSDVQTTPIVSYEADPNSYYTLAMVDPDAPNRKSHTSRSWKHWLMVNIPGTNISSGETLTEYTGSKPPENSGFHRYVFLIYKQSKRIEFHEHDNAARPKFSIKDFASKYDLDNPIAGNFFLAQH